jgi:hypothetical protein
MHPVDGIELFPGTKQRAYNGQENYEKQKWFHDITNDGR